MDTGSAVGHSSDTVSKDATASILENGEYEGALVCIQLFLLARVLQLINFCREIFLLASSAKKQIRELANGSALKRSLSVSCLNTV